MGATSQYGSMSRLLLNSGASSISTAEPAEPILCLCSLRVLVLEYNIYTKQQLQLSYYVTLHSKDEYISIHCS